MGISGVSRVTCASLLWHEPVVQTVWEWGSCDPSASIKERDDARLEFLANQVSNSFKAIWILSNGFLGKNEYIQQTKVCFSWEGKEIPPPTGLCSCACQHLRRKFDTNTKMYMQFWFRHNFFFLITCAHSYDQSSMPPGTQTWGFWRWLVAIMINSSFSAHMFFLFLRHRVLITKFCSFTTASAQLATASTLLQSPYQSAVWNDIFRQWEGHGDNPVALWIQIW